MRLVLIAAAAALFAAPALAQQPAADKPACAAMDAKLPADLPDWNGKAAITSAKNDASLAAAELKLGKGYEPVLLKTPDIAFPVEPEKPGPPASHGGLFSFAVEAAGAYTVALSTAAWLDVVEDGKSVASTAHGHGPDCTTIRKIVTFPLKPGKHVLQISGVATDRAKVLIARKP